MIDVLTFEVDRARYAVHVGDVVELLRATAVVPLPKAPAVVRGAIDYRGLVVPVLDLRVRFGAPARPLHPDDHFIMVRTPHRTFALRTDCVTGLAAVHETAVQPIETVTSGSEFVAGLARLPDGLVMIADPQAFLSEAESSLLDDVLAARRSRASEPAAR